MILLQRAAPWWVGTLAAILCCSSVASAQAPHPRLAQLAPNAALDLGRYQCSQPPDNSEGCAQITDYGRFIYDRTNQQLLMFGGGSAPTQRTDVDVFSFQALTWTSAYASTPCSAMRLANIDRDTGAWRSSGHPLARQTYDMMVMVDRPARLLLLNAVTGSGGCAERPPAGAPDPYRLDGRVGSYDPSSRRWSFSRASAGEWEPTAAAEWDPVSRKVVVIDSHFLWTYDPDTQEKKRHFEHTSQVLYGKNLVYFPPNDRMYYIADGAVVFEVTLDRKDFAKSTITRVTGITGDIPNLRETGFAYDSAAKVIGGGVRDGVFYAYSPPARTWISRRIETMGSEPRVGTVAFHALDYDPVNNVFVFLTDLRSGQRTWAFRFSSTHGANVAASRAAPPPWPGNAICPSGPRLQVGPARTLLLPSWAARCARTGDTVEIDAATYPGDVAVWTQSNLTIRGVGGRPHLDAAGVTAEGKGIWVIKGHQTTIENIEFSGAAVDDGNGAAIRQEGRGLTVRHCYFHHSQEGILTGADPDSEILIEYSEFSHHGFDDGRSHNIYVGAVKKLTIRFSYIHHARVGHNIKSRARETMVLYNRIMDEADGNSSYAVDIPNGGRAYLIGNLIQHGLHAENLAIVSYGAEGLSHSDNQLFAVNNTIVNDRPNGIFIQVRGRPSTVRVLNNIFAGTGTVLDGPGDVQNNLAGRDPGLRDRANFDYRLVSSSPAIDAGRDPGTANDMSLTPTVQYVHKAKGEARPSVGRVDIGALEYVKPD